MKIKAQKLLDQLTPIETALEEMMTEYPGRPEIGAAYRAVNNATHQLIDIVERKTNERFMKKTPILTPDEIDYELDLGTDVVMRVGAVTDDSGDIAYVVEHVMPTSSEDQTLKLEGRWVFDHLHDALKHFFAQVCADNEGRDEVNGVDIVAQMNQEMWGHTRARHVTSGVFNF